MNSSANIRKIIHIDMDAFYASVEQRDFPEYREKAIAVGGNPERRGGVVATASYEARKFGVHSAMPSKTALRLCPHLIFVQPRFDVYKEVSKKIHGIFHRYTDLVEPLSLDEAYLDVTQDKLGIGSAIEVAQRIKKEIKKELQLTASAGISVNKFVAKIASDMEKPDGLTFIGPSKIVSFMEALAIKKFHGVGKVTAQKMNDLSIFTGADLKAKTQEELIRLFGKNGKFYYEIVRGIDNRPVQPNRKKKSLSIEDTYETDLQSENEMLNALKGLCHLLSEKLLRRGLKGRTLTIKFKFHDFSIRTRSISLNHYFNDTETITRLSKEILHKEAFDNVRIRLLGVGLSNFEHNEIKEENNLSVQLELFSNNKP